MRYQKPESNSLINVNAKTEQALNGLGKMIQQYLEQNLEEFDYKNRQGLKLRGRVSVEVEKGIAVTVNFSGEAILLENGVAPRPDLHIKSSYLNLAKILSGSTSPLKEILQGNIKICRIPRRPIQAIKILRFLKVPKELLVNL